MESLRQERETWLKQKGDLEKQLANLPQQLAEAKAEAVAEFKRSMFFEENLILLQGSAIQMGQTRAIDVCSEVYPIWIKKTPTHPTLQLNCRAGF